MPTVPAENVTDADISTAEAAGFWLAQDKEDDVAVAAGDQDTYVSEIFGNGVSKWFSQVNEVFNGARAILGPFLVDANTTLEANALANRAILGSFGEPGVGMTVCASGSDVYGYMFARSGANLVGGTAYLHTGDELVFRANNGNRVGVSSTAMRPHADNTYTLGTTTERWSNILAMLASIYGDVTIGPDSAAAHSITRRTATAAAGGALTVSAGSSSGSAAGGLLTLQGGNSNEGAGGGVAVTGRAGVGTNRAGGTVDVTGGNATGNAAGGGISCVAGTSATGFAGSVGIVAGNCSGAGTAGSVEITAGSSTGGTHGGIQLNTDGGTCTLAAAGAFSMASGGVTTTCSAGVLTSTTSITIQGTAGGNRDPAVVTAQGGTAGGAVSIASGSGSSGNTAGGTASISAGDGSGTGDGGALTIAAGDGDGTAGGDGGSVSISGGYGNTNGGDVTIIGGEGDGVGDGGNVDISGGPSSAGTPGALRFTGQIALSNIITPSALASGGTNNYNPTGFAEANVLRLTPDAGGSTITSFESSAVRPFTMKLLVNIHASVSIILLDDDGASGTAANRIAGPNNADHTLRPQSTAWIFYDSTTQRWRVNA